MSDINRCQVVVKLQVEGIHQWKDCNINEVSFLKHPHRHIFYIECKKEVTDDNRQIEIICLKRRILAYLHVKYCVGVCQFGNKSCEMLAKELVKKFQLSYCSVLEDNENGAEVIKM